MNQTSIKNNLIYKSLLTIANPILGILTFPYISRVLGVGNIGLVNFVDNTISYFLLFASMGISTIGVRAIAASKNNQINLNKVFSNILGLNLIFTFIVLVLYNLALVCIPRFNANIELFLIGNAKIIFTSLLIEWFYSGIENFRFITIRSLLIRLIYIISIFVFIKDSEDYFLYFILTTSIIVVNSLVNMFYSSKFVKVVFKELFSFTYLKENLLIGVYSIMTSMYLTFNVMFLGLKTNDVEVGYYTSAFKLYSLILSVFTAFTSVMLPRMSSLISNNNFAQFNRFINKSFDSVLLLSFPLVLCGSLLAPEIIYLICGAGYEGAIIPMQIIMPSIILVAISQVLAIQVLMPLKKDNILLRTSIFGAIISLILNITLVSQYASIGSSIVLLLSELIVTIIYVIYVTKKKIVHIPWGRFFKAFVKSLPCAAVCLVCKSVISQTYAIIVFSFISSVLVYSLLNLEELKNLVINRQDRM